MRIVARLCVVLTLCAPGGLATIGNFPYSSPYEDIEPETK